MYSTVRSNIVQDDPLPKIKKVFARTCKEEQHHTLSAITVEDMGGTQMGGVFAVVKASPMPSVG